MMEKVCVMQRRYEWAMSYGRKETNGRLGRSDEIMAKIAKSGQSVVGDGIKIKIDEMARASNVGVQRSSAASFASRSVKSFKVSTTEICLAFVREVAAE